MSKLYFIFKIWLNNISHLFKHKIKKLNQLSSLQNDDFFIYNKNIKNQRNQNSSTKYYTSKTNLDNGCIMDYSNIRSIKNEKINNVNKINSSCERFQKKYDKYE